MIDLLHKDFSTAIFMFRLQICYNLSTYTLYKPPNSIKFSLRNLNISLRKPLRSRSNIIHDTKDSLKRRIFVKVNV